MFCKNLAVQSQVLYCSQLLELLAIPCGIRRWLQLACRRRRDLPDTQEIGHSFLQRVEEASNTVDRQVLRTKKWR